MWLHQVATLVVPVVVLRVSQQDRTLVLPGLQLLVEMTLSLDKLLLDIKLEEGEGWVTLQEGREN